jgi:hypothetical protein
MIQKGLHIVTDSLFSAIIIMSGLNFSFEKHICLAKESNTSETSFVDCCSDNQEKIGHSEAISAKKSCCNSENKDFFLSIPTTNESCQNDCCINVITVVKGINLVQQSNKKIELQLPVFQAKNDFLLFVLKTNIYYQKLSISFFHPPTQTISFNILYRVFRI